MAYVYASRKEENTMDRGLKRTSCLPAAVWLILMGATACASLASRTQMEAFEQTSKQYRRALLASDFEAALRMTDSEKKTDPAVLKNIHVVSYSLKKTEISENGSKVSQEVDLEYYRTDSMLQKSIRDRQQWAYAAAGKKWVLKSGLPDFN